MLLAGRDAAPPFEKRIIEKRIIEKWPGAEG
jgi:hypothetical protein